MRNEIVVVTADERLALRVRQLLARPPVNATVVWQTELPADGDWRGWPLLLLDEALLVEDGEAEKAAAGIKRLHQLPDAPVIILLGAPGSSAAEGYRYGAVDFIGKDSALSKLSYIVQEQWATARLCQARRRQETEAMPAEHIGDFSLRHEISNPLAGILGNAELALGSTARMAPEVRQRLERIRQLAMQIRSVLNSPAARAALGENSERTEPTGAAVKPPPQPTAVNGR
jgi:signal transduction histidine kinase